MDLFVVGSARSGTTHIADRIRRAADIAVAPETHFWSRFTRQVLSLDELASMSAQRVLDHLVEFEPLRDLPLDRDEFMVRSNVSGPQPHRAVRYFDSLCRALTASDPSEHVGEKTPQHLRYWRALSIAYPDAKFVGVLRDPRAVLASRQRTGWSATDEVTVALHWRSDAGLLRSAREQLGPHRFRLVRFEDAVERPADIDGELVDFLGLTPRSGEYEPAALAADWESWKQDQPVTADRTRAVSADELDDRRTDVVEAICWHVMVAHGYEPRNDRRPRMMVSPRGALNAGRLARGELLHHRHAHRLSGVLST